ncbi:hypothetical protein GBAR_LOCUS2932, partial [Geodia barretti]
MLLVCCAGACKYKPAAVPAVGHRDPATDQHPPHCLLHWKLLQLKKDSLHSESQILQKDVTHSYYRVVAFLIVDAPL